MNAIFTTWQTGRQLYLAFLEKYSLEQLNYIPEGCSNNLIWNAGHIVASQQKLI